jgi:isopentenyl-diphosphate delta-isomerase
METAETVILVDKNDQPLGTCEKLKAHQEGLLHRAFSVCVFNTEGKWLIQKRADDKYHSGGLWSNSCCSHPLSGLSLEESARKRLEYEMGFQVPLTPLYNFVYQADFPGGLSEHEFDHVLIGQYDGLCAPPPEEVSDHRWISTGDLLNEVADHPESFTVWFKMLIPEVIRLKKNLY